MGHITYSNVVEYKTVLQTHGYSTTDSWADYYKKLLPSHHGHFLSSKTSYTQ